MKKAFRSVALHSMVAFRCLALFGAVGFLPLACDVHEPELDTVQQFCAQMGWTYNDDGVPTGNLYEFRPLGMDPEAFGSGHPDAGFVNLGTVNPPAGSFETGTDDAGNRIDFYVKPGSLIVDDDDLTDDIPVYLEALALAQELLSENPSAVKTYREMDPTKPETEYTDAENDAVVFVANVVAQLLPLCPRLSEADATGVPTRPGDDLTDGTFPSFTACKDKYDASGDGIVGTFSLLRPEASPQDEMLASCLTTTARRNRQALNLWGPLTTRPSEIDGLVSDVVDGFTFSGLTVPLETSAYQRTMDRSEWEGVSFWARQATAEEAIPIGPTPGGLQPYSGRSIPEGARPQDGRSQVGIIVQTFDTAAVLNLRGEMDFMMSVGVCSGNNTPETMVCFATQEEFDAFPGKVSLEVDGVPTRKYAYASEGDFNPDPEVPWGPGTPTTPEHPYCVDYSPVDVIVGQEPGYRDHCWDGFRTMIEVTSEWKYYFLPFSEMRQAGWGRVAKSFRLDQIRSVNLLTSAFQQINVMVDEMAFYRRKK
jgi:hypothetical protein